MTEERLVSLLLQDLRTLPFWRTRPARTLAANVCRGEHEKVRLRRVNRTLRRMAGDGMVARVNQEWAVVRLHTLPTAVNRTPAQAYEMVVAVAKGARMQQVREPRWVVVRAAGPLMLEVIERPTNVRQLRNGR